MSVDTHIRSVALRLTATATAHLHNEDLEQALAVADGAVTLISRVESTRARDYVRAFTSR